MALNSSHENSALPTDDGFIGIFDSGAGGLSILGEIRKQLPTENIVYFGDGANNPYGEKDPSWVLERSRELTRKFIEGGAKAVVVACNTATAVAAKALREEFSDTPIIGVEPALKPATQAPGVKRILVMATPMTLHQDKYHNLEDTWATDCEVHSVECPGLALFIENGGANSEEAIPRIRNLIGAYQGEIDAVVLGCTHYPFISHAIKEVLGDVPLFDGAEGTARQVRRKLQETGRLTTSSAQGKIELYCSGAENETIPRYQAMLESLL